MPAPLKPWEPMVSEGEVLTIETIIGQVVGTGSMCWTEAPTGIFDSEKAQWAVEGALAAIAALSVPTDG